MTWIWLVICANMLPFFYNLTNLEKCFTVHDILGMWKLLAICWTCCIYGPISFCLWIWAGSELARWTFCKMQSENSLCALFPPILIGFKHFYSYKGNSISVWKLCCARFDWYASMQFAQQYDQKASVLARSGYKYIEFMVLKVNWLTQIR